MRWCALGASALLVSGCGGARDWSEPWADRQGRELPPTAILSFAGDGECYERDVVFILIGDPAADPELGHWRARVYVRNPDSMAEPALLSRFDADVRLPPDASFAGYRLDDVEVWARPRREDAIFVREGDSVERWPRAVDLPGCD